MAEVLLYVHRNCRFIRERVQDVHLDFHTAPELWGGLFQTRNMNEAKHAGNAPWHNTMLRTDRTYSHGTLNTRGMWHALIVQTTHQLRTFYNYVTNVQLNAFIALPSIISTVAMETAETACERSTERVHCLTCHKAHSGNEDS